MPCQFRVRRSMIPSKLKRMDCQMTLPYFRSDGIIWNTRTDHSWDVPCYERIRARQLTVKSMVRLTASPDGPWIDTVRTYWYITIRNIQRDRCRRSMMERPLVFTTWNQIRTVVPWDRKRTRVHDYWKVVQHPIYFQFWRMG